MVAATTPLGVGVAVISYLPTKHSTDREIPLGKALRAGFTGFRLQASLGPDRPYLLPSTSGSAPTSPASTFCPPSTPSSCGLSAGLHQACLLPVLIYMGSGPHIPPSSPLGGIFSAGSCLDIGRCEYMDCSLCEGGSFFFFFFFLNL